MNVTAASPNNEVLIKKLLAGCELPYEDITSSHLEHFHVLWDDDQLVGVIGVEVFGTVALLRSLAVDKRYRGQGLGLHLIGRAEEYAQSLGIEALYLLTTTAEGLFSKNGYASTIRETVPAVLQQTSTFGISCPSDAACMVKSLSSG